MSSTIDTNRFEDMQISVGQDIDRAVEVMRKGGVVLYPTDTVWGLGCDARNPEAIARVYEIKRRADSKALICLVESLDRLQSLVGPLSDPLSQLLDSPRPTTVIYPSASGVAPNLLAPDGSIGLRLTSELYSSRLCARLGSPVVSTSANISGAPSPAIFSEISPEILDAVDYIAAYRRDDTTPATPSRIVRLDPEGQIEILRQ